MRVAQINRWDVMGGAAIAAYRQHQAVRSVGVDSVMYVREKLSNDETVQELDLTFLSMLEFEEQKELEAYEEALLVDYTGAVGTDLGPFSLPFAPYTSLMQKQIPDIDIINLHWVCDFVDYPSFFGSSATKTPMVWTLHDMYPFTGGCHYAGGCKGFTHQCGACGYIASEVEYDLSRQIYKIKETALAKTRFPMKIVTPSKWLANEARHSSLFSGFDIEIIPYSVDLNQFKPRMRTVLREKFGLPQDKVIGFFPSHNLTDPRKGLSYLEAALQGLTAAEAEGMILLTAGYTKGKIQSPVEHRSLSFVKDQNLISQIYNAVDFTFLPSLEDNLPNIILESMASGTPLIAYDTGGASDFIVNGETGWLVPKRSVDGLASAILQALSCEEELRNRGMAARFVAEREFCPSVQGNRYQGLYESLIDQKNSAK
ncbi:glycosyltransferase [Kiloniella laminariae]|uniref:glycosyltransferase n=1 Tax=Kiloniella laminariae TaxID=454162 RepID=UPI000367B470|nr:glycosyltransferase [Kiloniella laminariae]